MNITTPREHHTMSLTLKGIAVVKALSQETTNFHATMYWNNVRVGVVSNSGQGGCHEYTWNQTTQTTRAKKAVTDELIDNILDEHLLNQQLKVWCKAHTVYRLTTHALGLWTQLEQPYSPTIEKMLIAKYGDQLAEIANKRFIPKTPAKS